MKNQFDTKCDEIADGSLERHKPIQLAIRATMAEPDEQTAIENIEAIAGQMCEHLADLVGIAAAGEAAARHAILLVAEWKLSHNP